MRCLVTGAAGFIGGSLVKRLVNEGHDVVALIHKTKPKDFDKKVQYVQGDITQFSSITSLFKKIDVVFHCAAYVKDYGPKKNFYKINVEGTKNLIKLNKENNVKRFIFLSHIKYESNKKFGFYSKTKEIAEQLLIDEYKQNFFPYVIIRPGNVFGPGATVWVLRNIESIKKGRIALVNNGQGIFLHTYIDNLLDALIAAMDEKNAIGNDFNITDGDYSITFGRYLNDLSKMVGAKKITRNMSKNQALIIGKIMIFLNKIFKIKPWVTPTAVNILTNEKKISIDKARKILGYKPKVQYDKAMKQIEIWLKDEGYI
jgi:nucleoside-diphosphate-sugar epimerase